MNDYFAKLDKRLMQMVVETHATAHTKATRLLFDRA